MGGGKGGTTETTSTNSSPPPQVMQAYQGLVNKANRVTSQSPQAYTGPMVANFTPQQKQAFREIGQAQGIANPYINSASQMIGQANTPFYDTVQNYESPYTSAVTNSLQGLFNQQNAQQLQQVQGNTVAAGAYGGDREAVAQALTAQQEQLSEAPTLANVLQGGYQTGLGAAESQGWLGEQGAFGLGSLGQEAQNTALTGAEALYGAGAQQQNLAQEQLNIPYEQFEAAQAAPYQNLNELASVVEGTGSLAGGQSSTTYPGPSTISQIGGLGLTGLGVAGMLGWLKRGGRPGLQGGGMMPMSNGPTFGGAQLPMVPQINLDYIAPPGPAVKGSGPPHPPPVQPQQNPMQQGLQTLGALGQLQKLSGNNPLFGSNANFGGGDISGNSWLGAAPSLSDTSMPMVDFSSSARGGHLQEGGVAAAPAVAMGAEGPGPQSYVQQFLQMPMDQLESYASRFPPGSALGKMVQMAIQTKRMNPTAGGQVSSAGGVPVGTGLGVVPQGASGGTGMMAAGGHLPKIADQPDMDPQPVVDHTGDTVVIHYPSEGKKIDLGIPSAPGMRRPKRAAGGTNGAVPPGVAPTGTVPAPTSQFRFDPTAEGIAIPQLKPTLDQPTAVNPAGGTGRWFNPMPQYRPPGEHDTSHGLVFPERSLNSPGMIAFRGGDHDAGTNAAQAPATSAAQAQAQSQANLMANLGNTESFAAGAGGGKRGGRTGLQGGGDADVGPDQGFLGPSFTVPLTGLAAASAPVGEPAPPQAQSTPDRAPLPQVTAPSKPLPDVPNESLGASAAATPPLKPIETNATPQQAVPKPAPPNFFDTPQGRLITSDESGNANVPNYRFDPTHTSGGYAQISDTNWRKYAPTIGVDLDKYPNALSAPRDMQGQVAGEIYAHEGFMPWMTNPRIASAVGYRPTGGAAGQNPAPPQDGDQIVGQRAGLPVQYAQYQGQQPNANNAMLDYQHLVDHALQDISSRAKTGQNMYASPWLPLIAMGAGMMASRSPFPGVAMGEGALAGLNSLQKQQSEIPENELRQTQAEMQRLGLELMPAKMALAAQMAGAGPATAPAQGGASPMPQGAGATLGAGPAAMQGGAPAGAAPMRQVSSVSGLPVPPGYGSSPQGSPMSMYDQQYGAIDAQIANVRQAAILEPDKLAEQQATIARLMDSRAQLMAQDPRMAGARAGAEAAAKFPYAGPTAAAEAAGKLPYQLDVGRPGSVVFQGGQPVSAVPELRKFEPATGQPYEAWVAPPIGGGAGASTAPAGAAGSNAIPAGAAGPAGTNPLYSRAVDAQISEDQNTLQKTLAPVAQKANDTMTTAREIMHLMDTVPTGIGADWKLQAARVLSGLGVQDAQVAGMNAANGQIAQKEFLTLSAQAVRNMGAREPGSVISLFTHAYPNLESQPGAVRLLTDVLYMQGKRDQDIYQMAENQHQLSIDGLRSGQPYQPLGPVVAQFNTGPMTSQNYLRAAQAMAGDKVGWAGLDRNTAEMIARLIPAGMPYTLPNGQIAAN